MPQPLLVLNTLEGPLQAVLEIQATNQLGNSVYDTLNLEDDYYINGIII